MANPSGLIATFDSILKTLLDETAASRTTLRLDSEARDWTVNDVVAEALVPGAKSFRGDRSLDQRRLSTVVWMDRERRVLIHNDCANADPPAPPELRTHYGVKAQMLGPIVRDCRLMGWISVHYVPAARTWTPAGIGALEKAVRSVHRELDAAG